MCTPVDIDDLRRWVVVACGIDADGPFPLERLGKDAVTVLSLPATSRFWKYSSELFCTVTVQESPGRREDPRNWMDPWDQAVMLEKHRDDNSRRWCADMV